VTPTTLVTPARLTCKDPLTIGECVAGVLAVGGIATGLVLATAVIGSAIPKKGREI